MTPLKLLLDTHVFLWWRTDHARLDSTARQAIAGADLVYVSAASAWEAAIKVALGKLRIPESMATGVADSGFDPLPIGFGHAELAAALPRHHTDPFDRMLIAQAIAEDLFVITHDRRFEAYDVRVIWT